MADSEEGELSFQRERRKGENEKWSKPDVITVGSQAQQYRLICIHKNQRRHD
jgi:hypothetical protein